MPHRIGDPRGFHSVATGGLYQLLCDNRVIAVVNDV
jgi:hypothetical protein